MTDFFSPGPDDIVGPSTGCFAVTTSDTVDFTIYTRGIYVGVAGDVVVIPVFPPGASAVTFKNAQAGSIIPIRARRINATNTTSTDIVGLY